MCNTCERLTSKWLEERKLRVVQVMNEFRKTVTAQLLQECVQCVYIHVGYGSMVYTSRI